MFISILRWFLGYVEFKIIGRFPERFMNVTINNGINVWDAQPQEGFILAKMSAKSYKYIRPYAKKSKVILKITQKFGLPFIIKKNKTRYGIVAGAICLIFLLAFLPRFVWVINISGNQTISETHLKEALKQSGLEIGTKGEDVDVYSVARNTTLKIDTIAWMSVNMEGCVANVEIKEKTVKPKLDDDSSVYNVKANKDGVILSIEAYNGKPMIKVGSAVSQDQLLVSGVVEDKNGDNIFVCANAKVLAQTTYNNNFKVKTQAKKLIADKEFTKRDELVFLWWEMPFSFHREPVAEFYSQFSSRRIVLNDIKQPFGFNTQTMISYSYKDVTYDKKTSEKHIGDTLALYEVFNLNHCESVQRSLKILEDKNQYEVKCSYVCSEDIAYREKIEVNDTTPPPTEASES